MPAGDEKADVAHADVQPFGWEISFKRSSRCQSYPAARRSPINTMCEIRSPISRWAAYTSATNLSCFRSPGPLGRGTESGSPCGSHTWVRPRRSWRVVVAHHHRLDAVSIERAQQVFHRAILRLPPLDCRRRHVPILASAASSANRLVGHCRKSPQLKLWLRIGRSALHRNAGCLIPSLGRKLFQAAGKMHFLLIVSQSLRGCHQIGATPYFSAWFGRSTRAPMRQ